VAAVQARREPDAIIEPPPVQAGRRDERPGLVPVVVLRAELGRLEAGAAVAVVHGAVGGPAARAVGLFGELVIAELKPPAQPLAGRRPLEQEPRQVVGGAVEPRVARAEAVDAADVLGHRGEPASGQRPAAVEVEPPARAAIDLQRLRQRHLLAAARAQQRVPTHTDPYAPADGPAAPAELAGALDAEVGRGQPRLHEPLDAVVVRDVAGLELDHPAQGVRAVEQRAGPKQHAHARQGARVDEPHVLVGARAVGAEAVAHPVDDEQVRRPDEPPQDRRPRREGGALNRDPRDGRQHLGDVDGDVLTDLLLADPGLTAVAVERRGRNARG
jgi:hypothetical protein